MKNNETVCAVVVTFNRKELLIECLDGLLKQTRPLDAIYIINNASTDGTPELLKEKGFIQELPPQELNKPWEKEFKISNSQLPIYYVQMHKNTGGAGGFHEGLKRAYEKGYDWFWLMDDDAEPFFDSLSYLEEFFKDDKIVALANSVIKPDNNIDLKHRGLVDFNDMFPNIQIPLSEKYYKQKSVKIQTASFVGLLVNKKAVEKIGYPKKEYFIHNDDIDYCLDLIEIGDILLIPSSKIKHKEASNSGQKRISYEKYWLTYYGRRNLITIANRKSKNKIKFYFKLFIAMIRELGGIWLYDDYKIKRSIFVLNKIFDGIFNIFDNDKPKKILYKKRK